MMVRYSNKYRNFNARLTYDSREEAEQCGSNAEIIELITTEKVRKLIELLTLPENEHFGDDVIAEAKGISAELRKELGYEQLLTEDK